MHTEEGARLPEKSFSKFWGGGYSEKFGERVPSDKKSGFISRVFAFHAFRSFSDPSETTMTLTFGGSLIFRPRGLVSS